MTTVVVTVVAGAALAAGGALWGEIAQIPHLFKRHPKTDKK